MQPHSVYGLLQSRSGLDKAVQTKDKTPIPSFWLTGDTDDS